MSALNRAESRRRMSPTVGFLLAKGAGGPITQIDIPGAPMTAVVGLDDRGHLVGYYQNPNSAPISRPARVQQAAMSNALPLGLVDGTETR